ncbi:MAG: hypothetical protein AAGG44_02935, partial [Planctomycetota bacterium]
MTNPFATFRKNQKSWMAALVLVAIFAFVIAPAFQYARDSFGGGGGYGNQVAVRWKGGSLTQASLESTIVKHTSLVRFMNEVATQVIERGGRPDVPDFRIDPTSGNILALGIQFSNSPADIVRTKVLAAHAKSQGVGFTDAAVDQFVQEYVDDKLSAKEVGDILNDVSNGALSYFEVREMLKEELSSRVVQQMALAGLVTENQSQMRPLVSPGKSFEDFLKLNQTAKVEAFPVFVDEYMEKVSDLPTESEIDAIYEVGSLRAPNPNSPDPGFLRRYQTNVEYVEANLQEWINREKEKLTDEELRNEYDRRVELGQLRVPVEQDETETDAAAETPEGEMPTAEVTDEASLTGEDAESTSDESAEVTAEKDETTTESDATEEAPAQASAEESTEPAKEESTSSAEEPAKEDGQQDPPKEDQAAADRSKLKLVSFVQEDETASTESAAEEASATPQEETAEASPSEEPQSEEASEEPQAEAATEESTNSDSETSETAGTDEAEGTPEEPQEPEMRVQTFEEAKDSIADSLARDKAIPALDEALTKMLEEVMRPYYGKARQYQAFMDADTGSSESTKEAPPKPDLKKLAADFGLKWGETGLVDGVALAQTPFGLGNIRPDETGVNGSVANVVMSSSIDLFRPLQSSYFDQSALARGEVPDFLQYLLWKTQDQAAYIPEKEQVRDEIIDAWKRIKARELAAAAAADIA